MARPLKNVLIDRMHELDFHFGVFVEAHEVLALEVLTLLLETPTDDSVEIAVAFLKECGLKLTEVTSRGVHCMALSVLSVLTLASVQLYLFDSISSK